MEGLKLVPYIALVLTIAGVIIGASVITLSKFSESASITKCFDSTYVYNTTLKSCHYFNTSNAGQGTIGANNFTAEYYSVLKTMEGETTLSEQQPTIAIIAVMVIIISIIAGVFVYIKFFS